MPSKKNETAEDVVRKTFPEFAVVKKSKRDGSFLPPDTKTPTVKKLHRKYKSDSANEESALKAAKPSSDSSATRAVVVERIDRQDATAKRLTVLVKQGKIKAIQG